MTPFAAARQGLCARLLATTLVVASGAALLVAGGCSSAETERKKRVEKADFHYKLALGYFQARNIDLAIRELVRALDFDAAHPDSRYLYGFILFGRKRYEEAALNFRRALERRPRFFAARNHLGVTYLELERYHEAIQTLEPLLKEATYTTPYLPHNNIGWAYLKLGNLRMAEKHLRMAVFLNPKFCLGHRNLGLLAVERRDTTAAIGHLEDATRRCPKFAAAWFKLGEAYSMKQRGADAQAAFRQCASLEGETLLGRRCSARIIGGGMP